jgi:5-methylcytosine-specific restriction endonuclease McrA
MTTFERELGESVRRVLERPIEHRPVRLPDESLSSTKPTALKLSTEGRCRLCGLERPLTRHHLVPESWFLSQPAQLRAIRNAHANIVPLCRPCHDDVDRRHPVARERSRRKLRATLSQQEIAFIIAVRDRAWLELAYPSA